MDIFKIRKIALYLLYGGLLLIFLALPFANAISSSLGLFLFFLGFGSCVISIVLSFIFWRCPHCGHSFGVRHSNMESITYCPGCGKQLRD